MPESAIETAERIYSWTIDRKPHTEARTLDSVRGQMALVSKQQQEIEAAEQARQAIEDKQARVDAAAESKPGRKARLGKWFGIKVKPPTKGKYVSLPSAQ